MSDWAPGDLALCVHPEMLAKAGGLYTVADVFFDPGGIDSERGIGLEFSDLPAVGFDGYDAWRFRRIPPHTPDAEDLETIELYRRELIPLSPTREKLRRATLNSNCGPAAFSQPVHSTGVAQ